MAAVLDWRVQCLVFCIVFTSSATPQQARPASARSEAYQRAAALAALGRNMFFDPALSGSGKISCASCHDPAFAYGPPNSMAVQIAGRNMNRWGIRAVPSLRYLQVIPQFTEHFFSGEENGDDSIDNGPTGGLTWDGRVDRGREQVRIPLFSSYEMANTNVQSVVQAAQNAGYSVALRKLSGNTADVHRVFATILEAFEAWEQDYREFYPYSSKYDAWLMGKAKLTDSELRGLKLFTDESKGNCARCHTATRGANGTPPQFTDYGLVALGLPRNKRIPANSNLAWYDLGLCGPERTDLRQKDRYCGCFMTPTLRNVVLRRAFFHNGVFHALKDAVAFYAQRDTNPEKWYPRNDAGAVVKFDDLPAKYRRNVEINAPFGRKRGDAPTLSDQEIDDIVSFLGTLTDGFHPVP